MNRCNLKTVMPVTLPFTPMEPLALAAPFQDDAFRYEVKWDGIRAIVLWDGGVLRVLLRKGGDITLHFPELHRLPLAGVKQVILDGELIVPDESNRPDFSRVVRRLRLKNPEAVAHARQTSPAVLMVFDMLKLEEEDLRTRPWWRRKELLRQVVIPSAHVQVVESFADGLGLFQATKQWGLEGIVAKRLESRYSAGKRHRDWYKVKHFQEVEAYIGGLSRKADGTWRSVYLGLPNEDGRLKYIGQAAGGLKASDWEWLQQRAARLMQPTPPFHDLPAGTRGSIWLKPVLRAAVRFQAWTAGGHLRSPVITRLI